MRIILEPTQQLEAGMPASNYQHRVEIDHPYDGLVFDDLMVLVKSALAAYGYAQGTIDDYFGKEE